MKNLLVVVMAMMALSCLLAVPALAGPNDKLIVKDSGGNTAFVVTNQLNSTTEGTVGIGIAPLAALHVDGTAKPQFIVSNGAGNARMDFLRGSATGVSQLLFGSGAAPSQVLDYQIGEFLDSNFQIRVVNDSTKGITITPAGNIGIGTTNPTQKLQMAGGAYTDGFSWNTGSSREYKENIRELGTKEAVQALEELNPVKYNYKADEEHQNHVGFIAEDVPDLVALQGRKALSPLDIVAVLTKVVQEQKKMIDELSGKVDQLEGQVSRLKTQNVVGLSVH